MKHTLLSAVIISTAGLIATAGAEVVSIYSSGVGVNQFNLSDGYFNRGDSLDGTPIGAAPANQWKTTDPYNSTNDTGGTSQLQYVAGFTGGEGPLDFDDGNNSVYWGGYLASTVKPGVTNPSLYYSFNQPYSTTSVDGALRTNTFSADFALFRSTSGPDDTFGFSLWTAGRGSQLASVQFTNINSTNYGVSINGASAPFVLTYGSIYSMQGVLDYLDNFQVFMAGVTAATNGSGFVTNYSPGSYTLVGSTLLAPGSLDLFETASIDWELASGNPTTIGNNYMLITSAQVASVITPEPSTVLAGIFLAAVTAYTAVRRRRQAKAEAIA